MGGVTLFCRLAGRKNEEVLPRATAANHSRLPYDSLVLPSGSPLFPCTETALPFSPDAVPGAWLRFLIWLNVPGLSRPRMHVSSCQRVTYWRGKRGKRGSWFGMRLMKGEGAGRKGRSAYGLLGMNPPKTVPIGEKKWESGLRQRYALLVSHTACTSSTWRPLFPFFFPPFIF